jgi:hypothetical protein
VFVNVDCSLVAIVVSVNVDCSLVADVVLFNSQFNRDSFLQNIKTFFNTMPNYRPRHLADQIGPKCHVLYFPIEFPTQLNGHCCRGTQNLSSAMSAADSDRLEADSIPTDSLSADTHSMPAGILPADTDRSCNTGDVTDSSVPADRPCNTGDVTDSNVPADKSCNTGDVTVSSVPADWHSTESIIHDATPADEKCLSVENDACDLSLNLHQSLTESVSSSLLILWPHR